MHEQHLKINIPRFKPSFPTTGYDLTKKSEVTELLNHGGYNLFYVADIEGMHYDTCQIEDFFFLESLTPADWKNVKKKLATNTNEKAITALGFLINISYFQWQYLKNEFGDGLWKNHDAVRTFFPLHPEKQSAKDCIPLFSLNEFVEYWKKKYPIFMKTKKLPGITDIIKRKRPVFPPPASGRKNEYIYENFIFNFLTIPFSCNVISTDNKVIDTNYFNSDELFDIYQHFIIKGKAIFDVFETSAKSLHDDILGKNKKKIKITKRKDYSSDEKYRISKNDNKKWAIWFEDEVVELPKEYEGFKYLRFILSYNGEINFDYVKFYNACNINLSNKKPEENEYEIFTLNYNAFVLYDDETLKKDKEIIEGLERDISQANMENNSEKVEALDKEKKRFEHAVHLYKKGEYNLKYSENKNIYNKIREAINYFFTKVNQASKLYLFLTNAVTISTQLKYKPPKNIKWDIQF
ncbi:hypothetical protein ACFL35_15585 [Candidatus Riflebacteria bacterium]